MIRRLRTDHRATFLVLLLVLPAGIGLALGSRQSVPPSTAMPRGELVLGVPRDPPARDELVGALAMTLRMRVWPADAKGARVLELTPQRDLELPDVLVYWAKPDESHELPAHSILLGSLAGAQTRRFTLPQEVHGGRLYLYSLGHQALVMSLEFER